MGESVRSERLQMDGTRWRSAYDRPLSPMTIYFSFKDRPLSSTTVLFWLERPSSLAHKTVQFKAQDRPLLNSPPAFAPLVLSTLILSDRPLWNWFDFFVKYFWAISSPHKKFLIVSNRLTNRKSFGTVSKYWLYRNALSHSHI